MVNNLNIAAIPLELRNRPNWVCYQLMERNGKQTKVPMSAKTYFPASSTDPSTWTTFEEAMKAAEINKWDGVGFCFEPPFVGVDLDDSVIDGKISDYATGIINALNSYTEISPSGTGIHVICKGNIPRGMKSCKKNADGTTSDDIEVYTQGRFFTMTGNTVDPHRIIRTADLGFLFADKEIKVNTERTTEDSWILRELNAVKPGEGETGRTPTYIRVIGSLKARGMKQDEVVAFLTPWSEQHGYGSERLAKLVSDQYKRYPPVEDRAVDVETDTDSFIEFLNDYQEVKWLIPGVLAENTINTFVGLSESRKSWLMLDLAVAFASRTPWLNKFECPQRKVLIVDQERPKAEMQRRLRALIRGRNISPQTLEGYLLKPLVGTTIRIDLPQSFAALCRKIEASRPEIILIDSFKAFQSKDICSNFDMQLVMERFKELRNKYGVTFGIIHHEVKSAYLRNREGHSVTMEHVAGAGPVVEVSEGVFIVQHNDSDTSMVHHVKNSYGQKLAPFMVKVADLEVDKSKISVRVA